jgi:hypothetical protein
LSLSRLFVAHDLAGIAEASGLTSENPILRRGSPSRRWIRSSCHHRDER